MQWLAVGISEWIWLFVPKVVLFRPGWLFTGDGVVVVLAYTAAVCMYCMHICVGVSHQAFFYPPIFIGWLFHEMSFTRQFIMVCLSLHLVVS